MKESQMLKELAARLRASGTVKLVSEKDSVTGLYVTRMDADVPGEVPLFWPITGQINISFVFDEVDSKWYCSGSMFGVAPKANDPRQFFMSAYQGARMREQTLRGFLQQVGQISERYGGDLRQMMYKVGVSMAAVGTMRQEAEFWVWTPSADPGVSVYFSPDNEDPQPFQLPKAHFGFNPDVRLHRWELTQHNLMALREQLKDYADQAQSYCYDMAQSFP